MLIGVSLVCLFFLLNYLLCANTTNFFKLLYSLHVEHMNVELSQKAAEATKEAHQPERDWEKSQFETSMERLSAEKGDLEQSLQNSQSAIQSLSEQIVAMSQELAVLEREEAMENEAPPDQEMCLSPMCY